MQLSTSANSNRPQWLLIALLLGVTGSACAESPHPADRPLTPAESLASIRVPEGFHVSLFAAEPNVEQPIAMTTDERGRLWVAENRTYAEEAVGFDTNQTDRIIILEDADNEGQHDKRTVFWDQAKKLTSVEVGYGGVYALCPPQLLFIPDRNRDDVPDGPPEVILDGWDADDVRHNIANGLKWGPDGWLYGRHGILANSTVGAPGTPVDERKTLNCGIWRFHPTRKTFEVVAHGTTNPWGFDFDQHGQMFFINTVIGHLWHLVPGAHYERMYGADLNPHVYELIPQTADHFHWDTGEHWNDVRLGVTDTTDAAGGGHAHSGLHIYQGGVWPERYHNTVLTLNFHGRRLNNDIIERKGSGYVGHHGDDFFFVGDPWFRGIELIASPDGGVFIADWSDTGECHEADGVHRASGRIYKLSYSPPSKGGARGGIKSRAEDASHNNLQPSTVSPDAVAERDPPPSKGAAQPSTVASGDRAQGVSSREATRGGIPKVSPTQDLATLSNLDLVALQTSPNAWQARQAARLLQQRAAAGQALTDAHEALHALFRDSETEVHGLRALWLLSAIDPEWLDRRMGSPRSGNPAAPPTDFTFLLTQLTHPSEHVRAWSIRLLADRGIDQPTAARLAEVAATDSSPLVRLFIASALQRTPLEHRWPIAEALVHHTEDAADPAQPRLIWYGLEPAVVADPSRAVKFCTTAFPDHQSPTTDHPVPPDHRSPITDHPRSLREHTARRIASLADSNAVPLGELIAALAQTNDEVAQLDILHGINAAFAGRRRVAMPPAWNDASEKLAAAKSEEVRAAARQLGAIFGDSRAIAELERVAADATSDPAARRAAIAALVQDRTPRILPLLKALVADNKVAAEAVRGLAAYDDNEIPELLLNRFATLDAAGQSSAIDALVSRPAHAAILLKAVSQGRVPRAAITAFHARQMRSFNDAPLTAELEKVWGALRDTPADKRALIDQLRHQLSDGVAGDPSQGRAVFNKTCSTCHKLYGEGTTVGPDLTGAGRDNLTYLLENIIDPSATVSQDFRTSTILLIDGRAITGVILAKDDRTLTVRTQTEELKVRQEDVDEIIPQDLSLMPDGLLTQLTEERIRNLFAYLQTTAQVPLPEEKPAQ